MKICDLHTHSIYSDGSWTPAQLIHEAERIGLAAIALTDHNTVAGLPAFLEAARGREVEAVPGVEFSSDHHGTDVHVLGLFIQPAYYDTVTDLLEEMQRQKEQSNVDLVAALARDGYAVDYPALKAATPNGQINRAHIATELTRLGYTASRQEAFERLLHPKCGYYHPPKRLTPFQIMDFICSIGAVPVLAHPYLTLPAGEIPGFLEEAVKHGLRAMETVYVAYDEGTTRMAKHTAAAFGLRESGGSDFHGDNKPDIDLGVGRGALRVPLTFLEELKRG